MRLLLLRCPFDPFLASDDGLDGGDCTASGCVGAGFGIEIGLDGGAEVVAVGGMTTFARVC